METTKKNCPVCGAAIPEGAPGGLCPACVLSGAAGEGGGDPAGGSSAAGGAGFRVPDLAEVGAAFPQFEVTERVGHGGMGVVYKARQPSLDRWVAIKVLSPGLSADPAFAERFRREAQLLAKLSHPNIVAVHDYGETAGLLYIVMEFVDGVNLRQAMEAGRFSAAQALSVIPGICSALQTAHAQGVLHRDIKPENILLDADGAAKIADFGIARMAVPGAGAAGAANLTGSGFVVGTRPYMAPEQIEGLPEGQIDQRADLYSLGVVLYEMLTGELPLGRWRLPGERAGGDPRFDEVVLRILEKDRELRYPNAAEFRDALEGIARGEGEGASAPAPGGAHGKDTGSGAAGGRSGESFLGFLGVHRLVLWACGLFVGGVALGVCGWIIEESYGGRTVAGAVVGSLGALAALFGFIGAWTALVAANRGKISAGGRWVLLGIAVWVPLAGVSLVAVLVAAEGLIGVGKGSLFFVSAATAVALFGAGRGLFVASRHGLPAGRGRARVVVAASSGLVFVGLLAWGKSVDGIWPMDHRKLVHTIRLDDRAAPLTPAVMEAASERALGPHAGRVRVETDGREISFTALFPGLHWGNAPREEAEMKLMGIRFLASLPTAVMAGAQSREVSVVGVNNLHVVYLNFLIAGSLAGIAAIALAFAGGRMGWSTITGGVLVLLAGAATPVWEGDPEEKPRLLDGPPLEGELDPVFSEPDFSTPEAAVRSLFDAGFRGDLETLKRGISDRGLEFLGGADGGAEEAALKRFNLGRVLAGETQRRGGAGAEEAVVATLHFRAEGWEFHKGSLVLGLEDGVWRYLHD